MNDKIIYQEEITPRNKKAIIDGLERNSYKQRKIRPNTGSFSFIIEDTNKDLKAGISGFYYDGCFHIDLLFVTEESRGKGYGSNLMKKAEELANKNNCLFMSVHTMDYQARPFYEKHGFEVEFTRRGYKENAKMYSMRKQL